jgi:hypothetical protein
VKSREVRLALEVKATMAEAPMAGVIDVVSRNLDSILERLRSRRSDMDRYRYLMGRVGETDVRADADFQRTFNGL